MKYLAIVGLISLLTACNDGDKAYVKYSTEIDDCIVKYVHNPHGSNFYIAKCPSRSDTITHSEQSGKTKKESVAITEESK